MDRVDGHTASQTPAEVVSLHATRALYAVMDMLAAARRAGDRMAIDAGEFCLEALVTTLDGVGRPALEPVREMGGNVVPFPVRRRG
ncbi:hypothetical protein [Magnetospirillum aberrantis]|uniref:Uncharacterized protein n=1 Tax=Magnetospirillum aberrantis SpK TaxID=908842 RepID=A0A7C9QTE2_9PROT|nr:hypothetical protein [Magnetospirillum aberrantis]NFV80022.1 hypothetical protein [Magnetospirillum aberrantis SpK]